MEKHFVTVVSGTVPETGEAVLLSERRFERGSNNSKPALVIVARAWHTPFQLPSHALLGKVCKRDRNPFEAD